MFQSAKLYSLVCPSFERKLVLTIPFMLSRMRLRRSQSPWLPETIED